ncbi:MAG: hypothetical protein IPH28_23975 [Cytophagaceae bacterium]|nr:hypothetical protein [Cytophagaceae bacterium]MBK9508003.1 hypothetical protein [Cytophagaceae bacterium]MBK9936410.1 hypothetical protein [Cytophagaceae bacterium]MBL0300159.1 hypothetical protein [Cytophagaceae bacterium]MBL0327096.1 hypothetical protein [Cytophagaceae bacterium]
MLTKLTLSLEKSIIEKAKSYAKDTGRSLSEIVENYFENITAETKEENLSPKLKRLVGSVKIPKDANLDQDLRDYFEKKHL